MVSQRTFGDTQCEPQRECCVLFFRVRTSHSRTRCYGAHTAVPESNSSSCSACSHCRWSQGYIMEKGILYKDCL
jgi:hypothetical protein